jgi:hypothetical protein
MNRTIEEAKKLAAGPLGRQMEMTVTGIYTGCALRQA